MIRSVWEQAAEALCNGDWAGYRRLWASGDQVELMHPATAQRLVGSDSVLAYYKNLIDSGFRCSYRTDRFTAQVSESGEAAWASAEGTVEVPGQTGSKQRIWYTLVFANSGGTWGLVHAHASPVGGH